MVNKLKTCSISLCGLSILRSMTPAYNSNNNNNNTDCNSGTESFQTSRSEREKNSMMKSCTLYLAVSDGIKQLTDVSRRIDVLLFG